MSKEAVLVNAALRYIKQLEGARSPHAEVAILGRSADLAFLLGGDLVTVECKVADWRKAIRQARDHKIVADFAYICLCWRKLTESLLAATSSEGIGVVLWNERDDTFEVAIPARRSERPWLVVRQDIIGRLLSDTPYPTQLDR
jgi:hypothetical protein